jgi:2-dehydropantoate 2-reductase
MTTIIVAGIGGVGGYFGGLLARQYDQHEEVKVIFFVRGDNLAAIREKGLKMIHQGQEWIVHPSLATDDASAIGTADYILLCTKSHHIDTVITALRPCIGNHTVLLPLLNGVDTTPRLRALLPHQTILEGCVYIISRLKQPGVVENSGNSHRLFLGHPDRECPECVVLERLFQAAGIEAKYAMNIMTVIWEKFVFISSVATITTAFDSNIGALLANPEKKAILLILVEEVKSLAAAKKISIATDMIDKVIARLEGLPKHATSSMHTDFYQGNSGNELESLTGYIVREAAKYDIQVPQYSQLYGILCQKALSIRSFN